MTLVNKGEKDRGCGVCDVAFLRFTSDHVSLLLLVKVRDSAQLWLSSNFSFFRFQVVVLFMAGKHVDAISRLDDFITDGWVDSALYVVQARETCPHIQRHH